MSSYLVWNTDGSPWGAPIVTTKKRQPLTAVGILTFTVARRSSLGPQLILKPLQGGRALVEFQLQSRAGVPSQQRRSAEGHHLESHCFSPPESKSRTSIVFHQMSIRDVSNNAKNPEQEECKTPKILLKLEDCCPKKKDRSALLVRRLVGEGSTDHKGFGVSSSCVEKTGPV